MIHLGRTMTRGGGAMMLLAATLAVVAAPARGQHSAQPFCEHGRVKPATASGAAETDHRYESPRATVRTFLTAVMLAPDLPAKIEDAVACLDLSQIAEGQRKEAGRLAYGLDLVIRSIGVFTPVLPDHLDESAYELGRYGEHKITLKRQADGRWLFDAETIKLLPVMIREIRMATKATSDANTAAANAAANADVPAAYRTPRATLKTFYEAFRDRDLNAAARCLDLSDLPPPARKALGRELAVKIKEVFDRVALVIFQDVPDLADGDPVIGLVRPEGRIALERQMSGDRKGQWLFGQHTIETIEELYDALEDEPIVPELLAADPTRARDGARHSAALRLRGRMPEALRQRVYLGSFSSLDAYQPFGLVLFAVIGLLAWPLSDRLAAMVVRVAFARFGVTIDPAVIRARVRPVGWLILLELAIVAVVLLDLRSSVASTALVILMPLKDAAIIALCYRAVELLTDFLASRRLRHCSDSGVTAMVLPVFSLMTRIVVVLLGLVVILKLFNLDVATVLTGLGIGGVAVALAAQDTLKSFFGSLTLIADRTFVVGDLVKIGDNEGVVESVGLRSTRIRGLDDSLLTVPNSQLATLHITNFGARRYRRLLATIGVLYSTPPETLESFREGILGLIRGRELIRQEEYYVSIYGLGAATIDVYVSVFFAVRTRAQELAARDAFVLDLLRLADRLGVELSSTTRPVQLQAEGPGLAGAGPASMPAATAIHAAEPAPPRPHFDMAPDACPGEEPAAAEKPAREYR